MLVSEDTYESSRLYCKSYINSCCIWRSMSGETLPGKSPGSRYCWQFYMSRGLHNVTFLDRMTDLFVYQIEREIGNFNFQITGLQTGATPLVIGLATICKYKYNINITAFSVRKHQKEYGLKNWIEGLPAKDKPVLIVDDLSNSANTIINCYQILKSFNAEIVPYAFTCVNKANTNDTLRMQTDKYLRNCGIENMKLLAPFTLDDFGLHIGLDEDYYMFDKKEESQ